MWWHEAGWHKRGAAAARLIRFAAPLALASLVAACFQPMYGDRSASGGPGLRSALASVSVSEIAGLPGTPQARLAVDLRNEINFALTGGGSTLPPTHRLDVVINWGSSAIIVDPTTARAEYEVVSMDASYSLVEIATKKVMFTSTATARASYNAPGQQQRFARLSGQRDAQERATQILAGQIRNRLASYLAAGS